MTYNNPDQSLAFLASGRIQILDESGAVRTVESRFAESLRQRAVEIEQRHAWKTQGRGAQFASGGLLWGLGEQCGAEMRARITSLAPGRKPGELLYTLDTDDVGGLFAVAVCGAEPDEQRLFHSNQARVDFPAAAPESDRIACSVRHQHGTANLALIKRDGSELSTITEGDSVDLCPVWVPGKERQLVFQSAGMGRDEHGGALGLGPFALKMLDLERGRLEDLHEELGHDLLGPRLDDQGNLYYIRRPYKQPGGGSSVLRAVLDFLLFPLRLVFALFSWLNFFTARYTGKPLTTAGGPRKQGADMQQMMVWGNLVDASKAAKKGAAAGIDAPALVPASWQLVRRSPAGTTEVLARSVLAFDLNGEEVIFSNGSALFRLRRGGKPERLHRAERISHVAVVPAGRPSL